MLLYLSSLYGPNEYPCDVILYIGNERDFCIFKSTIVYIYFFKISKFMDTPSKINKRFSCDIVEKMSNYHEEDDNSSISESEDLSDLSFWENAINEALLVTTKTQGH